MITNSGIHIQKKGGIEGIPTSMDIAVHAGRLCRFGGAIWMPLLPHLVFVGMLAYNRTGHPWSAAASMLYGFLHDAHECVTGEIPRPFKCDCIRAEQHHIDGQLLPVYLTANDIAHGIDYELLKQCDLDACDIEAMMLGLPSYKETVYMVGMAAQYGKSRVNVHESDEDRLLFQRIFGSPFYNDTILGEESLGVRMFAHALEMARLGSLDGSRSEVVSWGLL
jgi:hypothetical protein